MFGRLLLLFILVPILELTLFLKLGSKIGLNWTILIIVVTAILGAWLVRTQGRNALMRFQRATGEGRLPHAEVLDGLMILLAGAVLLTPGFLTDTVGFLLLLPPFRAVLRTRLALALKGRVQAMGPIPGVVGAAGVGFSSLSQPGSERVIEAEVIDVDEVSD